MGTVRIAAILSLSEDLPNAGSSSAGLGYSRFSETASYINFALLGQSLPERAIAKLKQFGISRYTVISECYQQLLPSRGATVDASVEAWERAVAHYVKECVDLLLLVRVSAYSDLDYFQFLQFHLENQSPITQA